MFFVGLVMVSDESSYLLVGKNALSRDKVGFVIDDFCDGRNLLFEELSEIEKIRDNPDLLLSSFMLGDIRLYALPFFEKESLKTERGLNR